MFSLADLKFVSRRGVEASEARNPRRLLQYFVMVVVLVIIQFMLAVNVNAEATLVYTSKQSTFDTATSSQSIKDYAVCFSPAQNYTINKLGIDLFSSSSYSDSKVLTINENSGSHCQATSTLIATTTSYINLSGGLYPSNVKEIYWKYNDDITFESGKYYEIVLESVNNIYWVLPYNNYVKSDLFWFTKTGSSWNPQDFSMEMFYDDNTFSNDNYVQIVSPEAGEVATTTNVNIKLKYNAIISGTLGIDIEKYTFGSSDKVSYTYNNDILGYELEYSFPVALMATTTYWATPWYDDYFGHKIYGTTILFHVVATSSEYLNDTTFIGNQLRRFRDNMKYKLPWGYYFLYQDYINSLTSSSTIIIMPLNSLTSMDEFGNLNFPDITLFNSAWFSQTSDFFSGFWEQWIYLNYLLGLVGYAVLAWKLWTLGTLKENNLNI